MNIYDKQIYKEVYKDYEKKYGVTIITQPWEIGIKRSITFDWKLKSNADLYLFPKMPFPEYPFLMPSRYFTYSGYNSILLKIDNEIPKDINTEVMFNIQNFNRVRSSKTGNQNFALAFLFYDFDTIYYPKKYLDLPIISIISQFKNSIEYGENEHYNDKEHSKILEELKWI